MRRLITGFVIMATITLVLLASSVKLFIDNDNQAEIIIRMSRQISDLEDEVVDLQEQLGACLQDKPPNWIEKGKVYGKR